jgi:hypothetical protein
MAAYISFQPTDFFNTITWTGTGATNSLTGVGFQPDFTWIKGLTAGEDHMLFDSVRGVTKDIHSNVADAETTDAQTLTAFDSDGFTVGTANYVNQNTNTFVGWNWKGGTTSGIAGSPSITPSGYSFNATSGCSIIKYTGNTTGGATIPHGLGVKPHMVIVKNLDNGSDSWNVNFPFTSLGSTGRLYLNDPGANSATSAAWNSTVPTSTLITLGSNGEVNASANMIFYAYAPVRGYSAFGEYEGNQDANGPFIYTGFRPGFVMIKNIDRSEGWDMYDTKRNTGNLTDNKLKADSSVSQEVDSSVAIDILSNGFKIRTTSTEINHSTCVYAAFAEFPLVSSNSKAGVAR